jgi:predicted dehydrogenase
VTPLEVGLVGAGPWAALVHAPVLAAGPETRLAAVWARRPEAAEELARRYDAVACASFDALVDRCEAVAFSVPPDVQAELAPRAAQAGRPLLLEKPIAGSLGAARRLVDAVDAAGVGSLVVLTGRFAPAVREFLAAASALEATGGRSWFLSGAFLSGPFSRSPWRHERGALLDVGPHALDLITAALGPARVADARVSPGGFVALTLAHDSGAVSQVSLCSTLGLADTRSGAEVFGAHGILDVDVQGAIGPETFANLRRDFAAVARDGASHACDANRGLQIQALLDAADQRLARAP